MLLLPTNQEIQTMSCETQRQDLQAANAALADAVTTRTVALADLDDKTIAEESAIAAKADAEIIAANAQASVETAAADQAAKNQALNDCIIGGGTR